MITQNILTSIVSPDQTAYVKGRYIGESIRLISDILEYTEDNSMGGILFSADFEKAFNSIEHPFIFATLQSFGFEPQFIHWVRTIFSEFKELSNEQWPLHRVLSIRKRHQTK